MATTKVKSLKSLPRTIRFKVTQEDIDNGIAGSCILCPIAWALGRYLTSRGLEYSRFSVDSYLNITLHNTVVYYKCLDRANAFMSDFDGGIEVYPFTCYAKLIK